MTLRSGSSIIMLLLFWAIRASAWDAEAWSNLTQKGEVSAQIYIDLVDAINERCRATVQGYNVTIGTTMVDEVVSIAAWTDGSNCNFTNVVTNIWTVSSWTNTGSSATNAFYSAADPVVTPDYGVYPFAITNQWSYLSADRSNTLTWTATIPISGQWPSCVDPADVVWYPTVSDLDRIDEVLKDLIPFYAVTNFDWMDYYQTNLYAGYGVGLWTVSNLLLATGSGRVEAKPPSTRSAYSEFLVQPLSPESTGDYARVIYRSLLARDTYVITGVAETNADVSDVVIWDGSAWAGSDDLEWVPDPFSYLGEGWYQYRDATTKIDLIPPFGWWYGHDLKNPDWLNLHDDSGSNIFRAQDFTGTAGSVAIVWTSPDGPGPEPQSYPYRVRSEVVVHATSNSVSSGELTLWGCIYITNIPATGFDYFEGLEIIETQETVSISGMTTDLAHAYYRATNAIYTGDGSQHYVDIVTRYDTQHRDWPSQRWIKALTARRRVIDALISTRPATATKSTHYSYLSEDIACTFWETLPYDDCDELTFWQPNKDLAGMSDMVISGGNGALRGGGSHAIIYLFLDADAYGPRSERHLDFDKGRVMVPYSDVIDPVGATLYYKDWYPGLTITNRDAAITETNWNLIHWVRTNSVTVRPASGETATNEYTFVWTSSWLASGTEFDPFFATNSDVVCVGPSYDGDLPVGAWSNCFSGTNWFEGYEIPSYQGMSEMYYPMPETVMDWAFEHR